MTNNSVIRSKYYSVTKKRERPQENTTMQGRDRVNMFRI